MLDRDGGGPNRRAYDSFKRHALLIDRIAEASTLERRESLAGEFLQLLDIPAANAHQVERMIYYVVATHIVDNRLRQAQISALNIGKLLRSSAVLEADYEKAKK